MGEAVDGCLALEQYNQVIRIVMGFMNNLMMPLNSLRIMKTDYQAGVVFLHSEACDLIFS